MPKILFVCLGNICRSPTADAVMRKLVSDKGLNSLFEVDSAGTAAYHVGSSPDLRSTAAAKKRGYDLSILRARQVQDSDFEEFDLILAMDHQNLLDLKARAPKESFDKIREFLDYVPGSQYDGVPDPYYTGKEGFEVVLDLVEKGCERLLKSFD